MAKQNQVILNFNRGLVSNLGLARQDIERISLSATIQNNFIPRVLGPMSLRPGFGYLSSTRNNSKAFHMPFSFAKSDTAILEFTDQALRVRVNESIVSRVAVSSAITNMVFDTDIVGWTVADEVGALSSWATGGYLSLVGNGFNSAIVQQQVSVIAGDLNKEHAIEVVIERGTVEFIVGSSVGDDDVFAKASLTKGKHCLAFTPTADFHISLSSKTKYASLVDSVSISATGDAIVPAPWVEADLEKIRYDQSGDIIYVACDGYPPKKILRWGTRSWGLVDFEPSDGPFSLINTSETTVAASGLNGDITLTATDDLFSVSNIGQLYRLSSLGQKVEANISAASQWSQSIRVTGVGATRQFSYVVTGTWVGTVSLQQSIGDENSWKEVTSTTVNVNTTFNGGLDNQIVYYRIGIDAGNYTSGIAAVSLNYSSGSISGVAKIVGFTSSTVVDAIVLKSFGSTDATPDWESGSWSVARGYPTAVALHEGRNIFGGQSQIWASVSDAYESFDSTVEGDSASFAKTIPSGPANIVNYLLSLTALMVGTDSAEWFLRSTGDRQALTPQNANMKDPTNQGSANVQAVKVDGSGVFVQSSGARVMESQYVVEQDDIGTTDLSKLVPEFFEIGVVRMAVQRQPDTRVHCVLKDGTVMILILDELENIKSWVSVDTDGLIEDVIVLSGDIEDNVYYTVNRTVNGSTVRYLEKWAQENECRGGQICKLADSHIIYDGVATATVTGLSHLEGKSVVVWADGKDAGSFTVTAGQITLATAASKIVVGLTYKAQWRSTKLGINSTAGTSLLQTKIINNIGLMLLNTHYQGLKYGSSFSLLDDLPMMDEAGLIANDTIFAEHDSEMFEFDGEWDTDTRVCLEANAPRPCTVLALIMGMEMGERNDVD